MTPREPDRYEAKAQEMFADATRNRWVDWVGVIERFAAALRREREDALNGVRRHVDAMPVCTRVGVLRLLDDMKSHAAAPAAETVRCMCPPGAVAGSCPLRNDAQSICECRCHGAPPSEPAPLLPRVLAALEDRGEGCHLTPGRARDLAAELRAYIAKAKGEGKT